jgi:tocopherol O-methyltransferase
MTAAAGATPAPARAAERGDRVRAWYARKTPQILRKYGPGPRVHFHTGLLDPADLAAARRASGDEAALQRALVASQERLLAECARAWDADAHLSGDVLDVGCGLGGGALYWAAEHGARVTALTDVPDHVPWIRRLALRAGVADRVRPRVADACGLAGPDARARFDAAVAIESSCYLDRPAWFRTLARVLRPGARVFVVDSFRRDPAETDAFDAYWLCRLGTVAAYRDAAAAAGFRLVDATDLTPRAARFWALSRLHTGARLAVEGDAAERARLGRSRAAHARFQRAFETRAIEDRRLAFARSPG